MGNIITSVLIARLPTDVFNFVTTPQYWPDWHPSSLSVSGATDHPLAAGEQVTEEFRVAGRSGHTTWRVLEQEPPHRWKIAGEVPGGGKGIITYTLSAEGQATRFWREFAYTLSNPIFRIIDPILIQPRIAAESRKALQRLKARLEPS